VPRPVSSFVHRARTRKAPRPVAFAFVLVTSAAVVRVGAPLVAIESYRPAAYVAGTLWSIAFAIFLVVYAPIVGKRRIDGKPG